MLSRWTCRIWGCKRGLYDDKEGKPLSLGHRKEAMTKSAPKRTALSPPRRQPYLHPSASSEHHRTDVVVRQCLKLEGSYPTTRNEGWVAYYALRRRRRPLLPLPYHGNLIRKPCLILSELRPWTQKCILSKSTSLKKVHIARGLREGRENLQMCDSFTLAIPLTHGIPRLCGCSVSGNGR